MTTINTTANNLVATGGYEVNSSTKGVTGQFDKLIELIKVLPQTSTVIIGAAKLKGVFKALGENSRDAWTFKQFLHSKGWELRSVGSDYTIFRQDLQGIVLTQGDWYKQSAEEVVDQELGMAEEKEMVDYSHECIPTKWGQVVADELDQDPSKLPKPIYPLVVYTGEVKLSTSIQLGVVYSTVSVGTDQGVKECKFLHTPAGVVTLKGKHFNSVAELEEAVKAAFKVETQEVSEATQEPEEVQMKPKTFCQLMKAEWIPSKDTWEAGNLVTRMRATWKSGKYPTDGRQKEFMKAFVAQVATFPQGVEMPNSAFLTAYDMVKERLIGVKIETPKFVSSMTPEEAAANFEGEHTVGIVTQTITKVFKPVALPEHLKKCEVKDLPKPEARSYREILLDKAVESVKKLTEDTWDMQDSLNLESICETFDGGEQYQVHVDIIRMWIQESTKESETLLKQTQEESSEDEELSGGKVTIKTMLGATYTIEVFYNNSKTLWINTRSGESFGSLYDLCMVHDKEYLNHSFFVNGQLVVGK